MLATVPADRADWVAQLRARARLQGNGCYLGATGTAPLFAPPEHGVLVLGPPRSGKTTGIVVPNVLAAAGAVVVSTKRDILDATASVRSRLGRCALFDPSATLQPPPGVELVGWSPLAAARTWSGAVAVAESMVGAARPQSTGDSAHWTERAGALLAVLFHAAALDGASMDALVGWVNRREAGRAEAVLGQENAELAADLLDGLCATDGRELSGIWSTASSVLAAYRTAEVLESAHRPRATFAELLEGPNTLYVVASAENQRHAAPIVAGAIRELREHAYRAPSATAARRRAPILLVLDELANIAPLHDLPELISEGGSQGLVTLACLQDLSQARQRWGVAADGFFSLFGAKVLLGGLGDLRTLDAASLLAGDYEAVTHARTWSIGGRTSHSRSTRPMRRLPPDAVAGLRRGRALVIFAGRVGECALPPFPLESERVTRPAPGRQR